MGCSSCAGSMKGIGHFGAYVPATARSYITTTGRTEGAPNASAGMHARVSGLGDMFGPTQTQWISGIQNEYVVAAGGLLLVLMMMK